MNKKIAIIGAGGHGKVIGEVATLNKYEVINFFDNRADEIKDVLAQVEKKFPERLGSLEVRKPWGSYKTLFSSEGFQVKILNIESGHQLSLQRHKHRSEHWTIVKGEAEITKGNETLSLKVDDSVYFNKSEIHSVKNVGSVLLKIIEVQVGDYLGEDDIERLEDIYDRPK